MASARRGAGCYPERGSLIRLEPKGIKVTLSPDEMRLAARVGVERQVESLAAWLRDSYGFDGKDGWTVHIEGACGELAAAKALGVQWSGSVNAFKVPDLSASIHVRTRSDVGYDLLVRPDDPDEGIFVLVVGNAPNYRVVGWFPGLAAKQPMYAETYGKRPKAYFVPQAVLNDIRLLVHEGQSGTSQTPGAAPS